MDWDLAGVAALLAVPAAAFGAVWNALSVRAPLARLEKLESLTRSGEQSPQFAALVEARDHLRVRVAIQNLYPGAGLAGAIIGTFGVMGFLLLLTFVVSLALGVPLTGGVWMLLVYGVASAAVGSAAHALLVYFRGLRIAQFLRRHEVPGPAPGQKPYSWS